MEADRWQDGQKGATQPWALKQEEEAAVMSLRACVPLCASSLLINNRQRLQLNFAPC